MVWYFPRAKKGDFYPQGHRRNRINSWLNDFRELACRVIGWFFGYILAMASVPVVLDAVGFMAFEKVTSVWSPLVAQ